MNPVEKFVSEVAALSFSNTFNPYRDTCSIFDFPESAAIRRDLLTATLSAAAEFGVDCLWIGRDLGYRGGRRTGLALTDEAHIGAHLRRWGIAQQPRVVKGESQAERTASVVWRMLDQIPDRIYLWNVFPLHPHEPSDPMSNRSHSVSERQAGEAVLSALAQLLRPRSVVAIGRDAARSAARCCNAQVVAVRHPSYGGIRDFEQAVSAHFRLSASR